MGSRCKQIFVLLAPFLPPAIGKPFPGGYSLSKSQEDLHWLEGMSLYRFDLATR
jgi:hypothetical protein